MIKNQLRQLYPAFASMDDAALDRMLAEAAVKTVPAGTVLFDEKSACQAFPMLLEGAVRVVKARPAAGNCSSIACCPARAVSSRPGACWAARPIRPRASRSRELTFVALPPQLFHRLLGEHEPFRSYVFGLFAERITELMQLVEAVAFHKLDQRLAALLLGKGKVIHATHQHLADELGSVREIVSRLLKSFAGQGLVSLGREEIEIVNPQALRRLSEGA